MIQRTPTASQNRWRRKRNGTYIVVICNTRYFPAIALLARALVKVKDLTSLTPFRTDSNILQAYINIYTSIQLNSLSLRYSNIKFLLSGKPNTSNLECQAPLIHTFRNEISKELGNQSVRSHCRSNILPNIYAGTHTELIG